LLKRSELHTKKANYNVALDVGSKDTKLYLKDVFLYAKDKELIRVKGKDDILKASGDRATEVESYMKVNKLNINKQPGLVKVFEFMNTKN
jgi:hypothetical protein